MGYSWLDGNLPIVGNPGIGWDIAWKRFVTVIIGKEPSHFLHALHTITSPIGCAASFIIMMFPPKSGRKAVRLRNASTMTSLSFIYSDVMAAWISSESSRISRGGITDLFPGMRERFLGLAQQIQAVKIQAMIAKWEGSIRGVWPGEEYLKLATVQSDMMSSLALVCVRNIKPCDEFLTSCDTFSLPGRSHRSTVRCESHSCTVPWS